MYWILWNWNKNTNTDNLNKHQFFGMSDWSLFKTYSNDLYAPSCPSKILFYCVMIISLLRFMQSVDSMICCMSSSLVCDCCQKCMYFIFPNQGILGPGTSEPRPVDQNEWDKQGSSVPEVAVSLKLVHTTHTMKYLETWNVLQQKIPTNAQGHCKKFLLCSLNYPDMFRHPNAIFRGVTHSL
jgi:hypothetical protein